MINEQMLIQELQNEREKAQNEQEDLRQQMELAAERRRAFDRSIDKVQLLLAKHPKEDAQPQLNKAGVMRSLPHDLKLLEELWLKRNPAHERQMNTDVDLFWGTVACVIDDYIAAVCGKAMLDDSLPKEILSFGCLRQTRWTKFRLRKFKIFLFYGLYT